MGESESESDEGVTALTVVMPSDVPALATARTDDGRVHPALSYIGALSEGSRRTMCESLATMARLLTGDPMTGKAKDDMLIAWWALRYDHTQALRALLADHYRAATVNKMLSALRGVLKVCWRQKRITGEEYQLLASVESVKGSTLPAGREIQEGERAALMRVCEKDTTTAGRRDAALIALLYTCGLRRAELAALTTADWRLESQALRIKGKRNKERFAYVADAGAFMAFMDWLEVRGAHDGPLFLRLHKSGHLTSCKLSAQGIYHVLHERRAAAGLSSMSPHDFRRTFVGDLLASGVDIATVQKMAGHANVTTTARYDRRGEEVKKAAAALLHVPYQRQQKGRGDQ